MLPVIRFRLKIKLICFGKRVINKKLMKRKIANERLQLNMTHISKDCMNFEEYYIVPYAVLTTKLYFL